MQEDEPINYKAELNKKINKLVDLRSRYDELKEDYNYIKSLNNKYFDEKIKLEKENKELKHRINDLIDNELEDRDIVCGAGKFRLEEWGKHRYHHFYKGDEELEDETVVIMLMELEKENKELMKIDENRKEYQRTLESKIRRLKDRIKVLEKR